MADRKKSDSPPPQGAAGDSYAARADDLRQRLRGVEAPSAWELELEELADYGDACRFAGRIEESETTFTELLGRAVAREHSRWTCVARVGLGNAHCARSEWGQAVEALTPALEDAAEADDAVLRARAECVLASARFNQGGLDDARALLERAARTAGEHEIPSIKVPAMISLGVVALAQGNLAAAGVHLDGGVRLADQVDDQHWAAMGRSYQATHAHLGESYELAAERYERSHAELTALGLRRATGVCSFAWALLALAQERWSDAEELLHRADADLCVTCPDYVPLIHSAMALTILAAGRKADADQRLAHARQLCGASTPESFVWLVARAEELLARGTFGDDEPNSIEARLFRLALRRFTEAEHPHSLVVDKDGARARVLPEGILLDLSRRAILRQIFEVLLRAHEESPGKIVPEANLIAAGWPGEKIEPRSARVRLQTAVSTLRKKGLRACLERAGEGYRLLEELVIRVVPSDSEDLR